MIKTSAWLLVATVFCVACDGNSGKSVPVQEATIESVRTALLLGRETCRSITQQSLDRIDALNQRGPTLKAVLETNREALAIADALDTAYRATGPVGPLHCVPLLVKDNFNTGDTLSTTAGSLSMQEFKAPADAFAVAKLRAAGAVLLGKTNMDEWAMGASGYGSRGGQVLNAHRLNRSPGGSSGGSAVGVAAGMGVIATGSDTGGSIRIPASLNGVVGIKPTLGLIGRTGMVPSSSQLDVVGPITRSVTDAAIMLGVMTGVDPQDPATSSSVGRFQSDYTTFLDRRGLSGVRVGTLKSFTGLPLSGANAESDAAFSEATATMAALGAGVVPALSVPMVASDEETLAALGTLANGRFRASIEAYFRQSRHPSLRTADDMLTRAREQKPGVVKNLKALENSVLNPVATDAEWATAQALRSRMMAAVLKTMDDAKVDALVFLTMTCPSTPLEGVIDPLFQCRDATAMPFEFAALFGGEAILMASFTGFPEITVPSGFTKDGLPIAVSFFGRPFSEGTLIRLAYAYEQASQKLRPPAFLR